MSSPSISSQRISFTQLVLDMGFADTKALLRAKKLIKERKAEGKQITVARACVELGILDEKQAKKVQRELKRLKEGFASSAFQVEDEASLEEAKAKREKAKAAKAKKKAASDAAKGEPSGEGAAVGDAPKKKKSKKKPADEAEAKPSGEGAVDAVAEAPAGKTAEKPKKKKKADAEADDAAP
ncbi:MAG: hypothetical protein KC466_20750, partial [Myxococcales bacterium]|nr:hypothetical protein [Myxococcales bacterium]